MDNALLAQRSGKKDLWVFGLLWALTFALYLPAIKAGWVTDAVDWVYNVRHLSFSKYLNNSQSDVPVLHQFTQLTTYLFYKVFHTNPYAWHGLQVTMHAVNGYLLFLICSRLFADSGLKNGKMVAVWGVVLYTVCPHISEAIIWKAAYDYLQGFLLILLILLCVQNFLYNPLKKYAWIAAILYLCSTYAFEIFYVTPWLVLSIVIFYRYVLQTDRSVYKQALLWFSVPQLIILAIRLVVLAIAWQHSAAVFPNIWKPFSVYMSRPPEYIFHILFLGRYFDKETRKIVYEFLSSNAGMIIFYNVIVLIGVYLFSRLAGNGARSKAGFLVCIWAAICAIILMPLKFPESSLVLYDRYTYFLDAFLYMAVALLISNIPNRYIVSVLLCIYALFNGYLTTGLNLEWKRAAYTNSRIATLLPDTGDKTVIFLNLPYHLNGVPMIPATKSGAYQKMYEMYSGHRDNKMYDAYSYNMLTPKDGAHVIVINDSMVKVTLNQWATWWWFVEYDGTSYENDDYILNLRDPGHWYELTLKHPHDKYMLVFQTGDQLRIVDWNKINIDQY